MVTGDLLGTGTIYLIKEPINARFGIPRLLAMLSQNRFRVGWNGTDDITIVTFNRRLTRCVILHCDQYGVDRTVRQLNAGRFRVMLLDGTLPQCLSRAELTRLLQQGTLAE